MNQRTVNTLCLLLAVAGLSFGIGQSVGQDRAEAGAQAAKVQRVKDTEANQRLHLVFKMLGLVLDGQKEVVRQTNAVCENVQELITGFYKPTCPPDPWSG